MVAKIEWRPGELYPRVGFIVTNMARPAERVVAFYDQRGTAEQWIKEGKNAVPRTRLSCHRFAANAVRLQLHAPAYNLANFLPTQALPEAVRHWSMTTLRDRLVKIGAEIVRHGKIDHVPDGRGHGAARLVRRDTDANCPVADNVRAGMTSAPSKIGRAAAGDLCPVGALRVSSSTAEPGKGASSLRFKHLAYKNR